MLEAADAGGLVSMAAVGGEPRDARAEAQLPNCELFLFRANQVRCYKK